MSSHYLRKPKYNISPIEPDFFYKLGLPIPGFLQRKVYVSDGDICRKVSQDKAIELLTELFDLYPHGIALNQFSTAEEKIRKKIPSATLQFVDVGHYYLNTGKSRFVIDFTSP